MLSTMSSGNKKYMLSLKNVNHSHSKLFYLKVYKVDESKIEAISWPVSNPITEV